MSTTIEVDTKTFVRFWLVIAGLIFASSIIWSARGALVIIALSLFLAIAIRPLARKLDKLISRKHPRPALSSALAVILVLVVVCFTLGIVGPMLINQSSRFFISNSDSFSTDLTTVEGINQLGSVFGINDLAGQLSLTIKNYAASIISDVSSTVVAGVSTVVAIIANIVLTFALTLLFMIQGPALVNNFWRKIYGRNNKTGETVKRIMTKFAKVIEKYVTGQVTVALIDACVVFVSTLILSFIFNFDQTLAFPLALVSAVFILIPMFGAFIAGGIITVLLLLQNFWAGIAFLVFYIIYQQFENNMIAPKIQSNTMELPSLIILISITIGMYVFGLLGAIISIPIAGIMKVLYDEYPNIRALKHSR